MSNKKRKKDKIRCANKRVDTEKNQNQRIKHVPPWHGRYPPPIDCVRMIPVFEGIEHDKLVGFVVIGGDDDIGVDDD